MGNTYNLMFHPEITPMPETDPKFDPQFGFKVPRKQKVMIATEEEMNSAMLEPEFRDYCAHHFIDFLACRARNVPWIGECAHEYHAWNNCLFEELIDTYKDYERERRLMVRAKRIDEKQKKEEAKRANQILEA